MEERRTRGEQRIRRGGEEKKERTGEERIFLIKRNDHRGGAKKEGDVQSDGATLL